MKTLKLAVAIAVALMGVGWSAARAQPNETSTSAGSTAEVVKAISIASQKDLNFGDVFAGATAGKVVLSTTGKRSVTGGTTLGDGSNASAAIFLVRGEPGTGYTITLPHAINLQSGSNNMLVDAFTSTPPNAGILGIFGEQMFGVGASLHVGASQAPGTYTNTFEVTVAYN